MTVLAALLAILLGFASPAHADETAGPHQMTKSDGSVDIEKCGACHEEDLSLSRSKSETCTLCHAATLHAGAAEHLGAEPAAVARLIGTEERQPALPLADNGGIYCGTCHLFHDPAVSQEQPLPPAQPAPTTGPRGAVSNALPARWDAVAKKYSEAASEAKLAATSTRALRLPVNDGSLCIHCHGSKAK